jgi:N-acetyl-gamma-glutamyl-phosphate reductase
MRARAGIVGFRGYGGAELLRLLERHPRLQPWLLDDLPEAAERPRPPAGHAPWRRPVTAEAVEQEKLAVVFLATPAEVSMERAPGLLEADVTIIDLSGAFRLRTPENYTRWYKEPHTHPELLAAAVYGLPELGRERLRGARLIANPGCYPTPASLALQPLVASGVVDRAAGIVCDAKSGASGAGRKPSLKTSFCEVTENFSCYSLLDHRHVPEVLLNCGLEEGELSFTAHLLPVERGILETIYFRTRGLTSAAELMRIYEERYRGEPFIRLYPPGQTPDLRAVQRTNYCDLGARLDGATGRAVVVAAIDNLVKGAAGQAVQNMNLALGWPETEGLR